MRGAEGGVIELCLHFNSFALRELHYWKLRAERKGVLDTGAEP